MIVQCSWKVSDDRPVLDAVICSDIKESTDIEDEITSENCLMLEAPCKDSGDSAYPTVPACQLLLSSALPNQITHISILCEARVMEVYGHHGEYLKTVRNNFLEADDEMMVLKGDIALEKPLNMCSIKFTGLRSPSEMWLFGVKVITCQADKSVESKLTIPMEAVEQRLSEMGLVLSDKAEAFKQIVERCNKSPTMFSQDVSSIINNLLLSQLVQKKSLLPQALQELRDNENNLPQNIMKLEISDETGKVTDERAVSVSPINIKRSANSTQTDEEYLNLGEQLKTYIADKLEHLDQTLNEKINRKFQELEAKVMCKLEEIESFVKPHGVAS